MGTGTGVALSQHWAGACAASGKTTHVLDMSRALDTICTLSHLCRIINNLVRSRMYYSHVAVEEIAQGHGLVSGFDN